MTLFKQKFCVESHRLPDWDYAQAGLYFITICTKNRECCLGEILNQEMKLSEMGEIVQDEWIKTEQIRRNLFLDHWVIMPNHLHGIIGIRDGNVETPRWGVSHTTLIPNSLGSIVGQFKSKCTKRIWQAGYQYFGWQPRFYDHIIRDEETLGRIREYIKNNPLKWAEDKNNPKNF